MRPGVGQTEPEKKERASAARLLQPALIRMLLACGAHDSPSPLSIRCYCMCPDVRPQKNKQKNKRTFQTASSFGLCRSERVPEASTYFIWVKTEI